MLGPPFPSLVAQLDPLGNERGGVRSVEIDAPLATYYPWSLRLGLPGEEHELADFEGTYVPLPWSESERQQRADPRPSIESLYPDRGAYLARVRQVTQDLVERRFLLEEDVERVTRRAAAHWDWLEARR